LVYETAGHAISTTGGGGPAWGSTQEVVPTDEIGRLYASMSGPLVVQPDNGPIAALVAVATLGGAHITGMNMTMSVIEQP
jgi:hypothetical protein